MSRLATITQPFADGDYSFRLGFAQLVMLQEARDCGPYVLQMRLASHQWRVEDITETIRVGLIGGGVKPPRAAMLVREYVQAYPPLDHWDLALKIISAALAGSEDEPMGESLPPSQTPAATSGSKSTTSQTANSDSQNSTASPPPSASDPSRSINGHGSSSGPSSPDGRAPTEQRAS